MTARPTPRPEPVIDARSAPSEVYGPDAFARDLGDRATLQVMADLERFRAMVEARNAVMNLVGPATLPDFWRRHALDSAQLLFHVEHTGDTRSGLTWADLGAGAGFPGVVLAILLKGRPGAKIWLVDSLTKRCVFLEEVVKALDLPAEVVNARAETVDIPVQIVTARACAPMVKLLGFAEPWFRRGAQGLFLKGEGAAEEIEAARAAWRFDPEILPSVSDPRGRIVRIRRLARVR